MTVDRSRTNKKSKPEYRLNIPFQLDTWAYLHFGISSMLIIIFYSYYENGLKELILEPYKLLRSCIWTRDERFC